MYIQENNGCCAAAWTEALLDLGNKEPRFDPRLYRFMDDAFDDSSRKESNTSTQVPKTRHVRGNEQLRLSRERANFNRSWNQC